MPPNTVSIVLPFRNAADTLVDCLTSIQKQTLDSFECLCIDDASTDKSASLVAEIGQSDPRIKLITNPNPGLVNALNLGIANANTNLIARMDADDLMLPERLQKQLSAFESDPALTLVATRVKLFPEENILAGYREYIRWQNDLVHHEDIYNAMYTESPFAHPSVMFSKAAVDALGGYRQGVFPEDYDLWLRMATSGCRFLKIPEILLLWRDHPTRLSRTAEEYAETSFDQLRASYLSKDQRLRERPLAIWGAGRKTRLRTRHLLGYGFQLQAWIDIDPKKIGNRLNGVPVVASSWLKQTPKPFVLCYVRSHGAKEQIAEELTLLGYECGADYLMVG